MRPTVVLSGQKWFGDEVLLMLRRRDWIVAGVAAPENDRLRDRAIDMGLQVEKPCDIARLDPGRVADLLICADHRTFIHDSTRALFPLGVLAFHGSFLPRHRGGSAVEWTIRFRDPIAGASIYWMDDGMDTGPIAAREAVHVQPGEDSKSLWRRAIAPLGLELFGRVFADIEAGRIVKIPQEQFAATFEPAIRVEKAGVPLVGAEQSKNGCNSLQCAATASVGSNADVGFHPKKGEEVAPCQ